MKQLKITALILALSTTAFAQLVPPQLFSGMDGVHELADGTILPIWGYGWVADGEISLPGPFLQYLEGDEVNLAFTNPSPESHTIHLHGLDVDQANDGVPQTSFQVATGESAEYNFTATHTGTYLYHCHVTTTLHLTMGMYGMILVTRPDNTLYAGGPEVSADYPLLFSDLEIATNMAPVQSFPFHDIRPDIFMVNGLSDQQLFTVDQTIWSNPSSPVALRLGSMAYSIVHCHFPAELNAQLYMSDGRAVNEPISLSTLEIFPGERFTVLINTDPEYDGSFTADFRHMLDGTIESSQQIPVRDLQYHPSSVTEITEPLTVFPNPSDKSLLITGASEIVVRNSNGKVVFEGFLINGDIDVSGWPQGVYFISAATDLAAPVKFVVLH